MPKKSKVVPALNGGILSEGLKGRADLEIYHKGCFELLNMIPQAQGGLLQSPGTAHVAEVQDSSLETRLIPFVYSNIQAYMLEAGNLYFRFYKDHGQINHSSFYDDFDDGQYLDEWVDEYGDYGVVGGKVRAVNVNNKIFYRNIPGGTFVSLTWQGSFTFVSGSGVREIRIGFFQNNPYHSGPTTDGYSLLIDYAGAFTLKRVDAGAETVIITGTWTPDGSEHNWKVTVGSSNDWEILFGTGGSFTSKGTATDSTHSIFNFFSINTQAAVGILDYDDITIPAAVLTPVQLTSPYLTAQLFDLQTAQSADTLYIAHRSHEPRKLIRFSDSSWELVPIVFVDGPYLAQNTVATKTLQANATTGTVTITAVGHSPFVSTDVGRFVRILETTWGYAKITAVTDNKTVTALVLVAFGGTGAQSAWRLGAWSDTTGYPGSVVFHENRLVWASTAEKTQSIWGSKTDDYENHTPGANDDDPLDFTLVGKEVETINWLASGEALTIGATNGVHLMRGAGTDNVITPSNVKVKREVGYSTSSVEPARVGNILLFPTGSNKTVRELVYKFEDDGYVAADMMVNAGDLYENPGVSFKEMTFQQEPYHVLWCVTTSTDSSLSLVGMVYNREHNVVAWWRCPLAGLTESVATIPVSGEDETWVIVNRTIDGGTARYIEYFKRTELVSRTLAAGVTNLADLVYMSSNITYDGVAATTITGLDHLEGMVVGVLADGVDIGTKTVASGQITLDDAAEVVQIGLLSTAQLTTMPLELGPESMGIHKSVVDVKLLLELSMGGKYGLISTGAVSVIDYSDQTSTKSAFTGWREITLPAGTDYEADFLVSNAGNLPLNINAFVCKLDIANEY